MLTSKKEKIFVSEEKSFIGWLLENQTLFFKIFLFLLSLSLDIS